MIPRNAMLLTHLHLTRARFLFLLARHEFRMSQILYGIPGLVGFLDRAITDGGEVYPSGTPVIHMRAVAAHFRMDYEDLLVRIEVRRSSGELMEVSSIPNMDHLFLESYFPGVHVYH